MRYMRPAKGRKSLSFGALKSIRSRIEYLAKIHNCSMSFVENTLLARALDIDIGEAYDDREAARKSLLKEGTNRRGNTRNYSISG